MSTEYKNKSVYYLEELSDYKVANDDKDVRGWDVKDTDGRTIGKVDNLLVNKNTERVVYLDVEVVTSIIEADFKPYSTKAKEGVHDFINEDGDIHLIIPIGMADLDLDHKNVTTSHINHDTFAKTKRVKKGAPIHREYEVIVLDTYTRSSDKESYGQDDTFHERKEFKR